MGRRGLRIWVDGKEYNTRKEAARAAGLAESTLSDAVEYGPFTLRGHRIDTKPPRKPVEFRVTARGDVLLRYPFGEKPLDRGLGGRWK